MRLLRVQIPEFRALKDVDISFDPNFTPQVFPLGSLNGGGKSTFLQLVFILLHCSAHSDRHEFITNLLERVTIPKGDTSKLLARFELMSGDEKIELEFALCNDDYLRSLKIEPIFNKEKVSFEVFLELKKLAATRRDVEEQLAQRHFYDLFVEDEVVRTADELYEDAKNEKERLNHAIGTIQPLINSLTENLTLKNQYLITAYSREAQTRGLLCHLSNPNKTTKDLQNILTALSKQVFLSAPSTQIYLFISKEAKKSLFKKIGEKRSGWGNNYESYLNEAKNKLPNFLTFDVFASDFVTSLIEKARNQDFKTFIDTGINGTSYQQIIAELNILTQGKKVLPLLDENAAIIGIVFKNADDVEIYPEDLSHGELKRLSIYLWLKSLPRGENIVLIDEIENGFHPDWQYQIVRDLVEWGESNQYILATHSYELCNALTPAHVKELEPKLVNN